MCSSSSTTSTVGRSDTACDGTGGSSRVNGVRASPRELPGTPEPAPSGRADDAAMSLTAPYVYLEHREQNRRPQIDIVVPVYNEADGLEASVRRLVEYLNDRFPLSWVITIADNASTDGTWSIACRLTAELPGVRAVHLDKKGRGRALKTAWSGSESPVVAYMDVDLSTDLDALL